MAMKIISRFGSWASPITSEMVSSNSIHFEELRFDGEEIYWLEFRPSQSGRQVIVRYSPDGMQRDLTPPDFNVRTKVHEYGGGAYLVYNRIIYFTNFADQRVYRQLLGKSPEAITPVGNFRFADYCMDDLRQNLICIREEHSDNRPHVENTLVSISLSGVSSGQVLVSGNDFYSNPRLSPDNRQLAWLTWNHPNMPWDGCELWLADLDPAGNITHTRLVAGGQDESIFQPEWSPEGVLHFISDRTGWWNLYRWKNGKVEPLHEIQAEFGLPQWVFGLSTYGFSSQNEIICSYRQSGKNYLARLNTKNGNLSNIQNRYAEISSLCIRPGKALFVGGSIDRPAELVLMGLSSSAQKIIRKTSSDVLENGFTSIPQVIEYRSQNGLTSYGNFYPPANKNQISPRAEKPPLIVMLHGGPTSQASTTLNLKIQFWTSRGFAILDVNYSGSTGFGQAYRKRLNGNWGITDVIDCINGAKYLATQNLVDGQRMSITGGSAGGYTALCAITFDNTFSAGVSRYGIASLETLASGTHKFESHYLDRLVGPYPEAIELYQQRSPINFIEQINAPILLMQGTEDLVVPPAQSEGLYQVLAEKGLPVAYVTFEGEQHGFRKAESIQRALDVEYYFYSKIFGFHLPEEIDPIEIKNLDRMGDPD